MSSLSYNVLKKLKLDAPQKNAWLTTYTKVDDGQYRVYM